MAKTDFVTLRKLQQIASGTALTNGLTPISRELISHMYFQKGSNVQPILRRCEKGTLWVDKYYVAYQLGGGDVHYTYIAKTHIGEEAYAYRQASKERGEKVALQPDILRSFRIARRKMQMTGQPYWIAKPWAEETKEVM